MTQIINSCSDSPSEEIRNATSHLLRAPIPNTSQAKKLEKTLDYLSVPSTSSTSKEMTESARNRIRQYYNMLKTRMQNFILNNPNAKTLIDKLLGDLFELLIAFDHFGNLFNKDHHKQHTSVPKNQYSGDNIDGGPSPKKRKKIRDAFKDTDLNQKHNVSLCDSEGKFYCQGYWYEDQCNSNHVTNPYQNKEELASFQIWNFDHKIEQVQTAERIKKNVVEIINSSVQCKEHNKLATKLPLITYFRELFTMENLRFVHIACHDKKDHVLESTGSVLCEDCDEYNEIDEILEIIKKASE